MEMGVDEYADTSDYDGYDTADEDISVSDGNDVPVRRSTRVPKPNPRYMFIQDTDTEIPYDPQEAQLLAWCMTHSYDLQGGLNKFGQRGEEAVRAELQQLHDRKVFAPVDMSTLSDTVRSRAMESLVFLAEKGMVE